MNEKEKQKVVKMSNFNCPNCGAPISGDRCDYCGTQFIDCTTIRPDKPFYLKFSPDGQNTIISKVYLENLEISMERETIDMGRDINGTILPVCVSQNHRFTATYVSAD